MLDVRRQDDQKGVVKQKQGVRIVRGLRLVSTLPGFWRLESDPLALFQFMGKARIGHPGSRYSVDRWLTPTGDVATSLEAAVKSYLAKRSKIAT